MPSLPRSALAVGLVFLAGCTIQQEQPVIEGQDVSLTILHTSDIHSRLLPYDLQPLTSDRNLGLSPIASPYGGAARLASLLERERARADRVIHVDSGDCFQGAPIFNENSGEAEIRWLSMMGADAVVVGNHEFDAGAWNLYDQVARHATYPLLAANYEFRAPGEPGVPPLADLVVPYTIVNAKGLKVGLIGMANISSLNSIVAEGNSMGIAPLEQNEALRSWVEFVEPQVDLVVVVSHLGLTEDVELVKGYERTLPNADAAPFLDRAYDPWQKLEDFGDGTGLYLIPGVRGLDVIMGGHLHVVLDPPQVLVDRDGREVVLSHSGAFAKYLGRLDLILHNEPGVTRGWDVKAHTYNPFPVDALWCMEQSQRDEVAYDSSAPQIHEAAVKQIAPQCAKREHLGSAKLLAPYILGLNLSLDLPEIFAYAPKMIARYASSAGGDSSLGNLTVESMLRRSRVDAEIAITNTLGIRDHIYQGPVNVESMFNVFPFENTITLMYLSGSELQEVLDYVADRSAGRGCQAQAQVAGVHFMMDCGQSRANDRMYACSVPEDCPNYDPTGTDGISWQCVNATCWDHPAKNVRVPHYDPDAGTTVYEPIDPGFTYKVATNNYIAQGGSGFRMLKRNTTQFDTGISLRDALVDYMQNFCSCREILEQAPADGSAFRCSGRVVDATTVAACRSIESNPMEASAGKCTCGQMFESLEILSGEDVGPSELARVSENGCGHITDAMQAFCASPLDVPMVVGVEDGRIGRRVVDRSIR